MCQSEMGLTSCSFLHLKLMFATAFKLLMFATAFKLLMFATALKLSLGFLHSFFSNISFRLE